MYYPAYGIFLWDLSAGVSWRAYIVGSVIHGNMGFGHDNLTHNFDYCLLILP